MPLFRLPTRLVLSMALMIFVMGALWLTAVPDTLRVSTYVSIAVLLTALTAITMTMYTSGQAHLGTLVHPVDSAPTPGPRRAGNGLDPLRIR